MLIITCENILLNRIACLALSILVPAGIQPAQAATNAKYIILFQGDGMATGVKVNNGVISVRLPGDGSKLTSLLELRRGQGRSTGLVTTSF
jgi:alkaline phosphatase